MLDYAFITEKGLNNRYAALPQRLQDVLDDEGVYQAVSRACQNHHVLDEEKVLMIEQLTALVIFGFIHAEDLAREIDEALLLNNHRLSRSLADEVDSKVFKPIKAELEKNYRPFLIKVAPRATVIPASPPPPPKPIDLGPLAQARAKEIPIIEKKTPEPPKMSPIAPPKMMSEIGQPNLAGLRGDRLTAKEVAPPKPAETLRPSPMPPLASQSLEIKKPGMGPSQPVNLVQEIKNLEKSGAELVDVLKKREGQDIKAPSAPPSLRTSIQPFPKPPEPTPGIGPTMLHQESEPQPIRSAPSFKIGGLPEKWEPLKPSAPPPPTSVARVELGRPQIQPQALAKTEIIRPPKVIHYSAFQTPLEKPPTPSTPPTPVKPPMPTSPAMPPLPPKPQMADSPLSRPAPNSTPKVQDFLSEAPTTPKANLEPNAQTKTKGGWLSHLFGKSEEPEVNFSVLEKEMKLPPKSPVPPLPPGPVGGPVRPSMPPPNPTTLPSPDKATDIRVNNQPAKGPGEEMIDLETLRKIGGNSSS